MRNHLLWRFLSYMRPHKRWLILGLLMIPLVAGMTALRPLLVKKAVDTDIPQGDFLSLRITALLFLVAIIAEFLAQAVQIYTLQRAGHMVINDLRRDIFRHVLHLPSRFFDTHPTGTLLARSTSDIESLSETLAFGVFTILTDVVIIFVTLIAMFALDVRLTLISLATAPVLFIIIRIFSVKLRHLQLEIRKAQGAQSGFLAEQLTGVTVVQLFRRQKAAANEYERLGQRYLQATKTANIYEALLYSLMDGIVALVIALLIYFSAPGLVHAQGTLTLGLLFAFIDYLQRIFVPIREFSGKLAIIQRALAALTRIYALLDEPTEERSSPTNHDPLDGWQGGLQVHDLYFRYRPEDPDVLKGICFSIAPGEVIALVGRTGSGKTSIGRLLTRMYDGYRGSIRLQTPQGEQELAHIAPDILRKHILQVSQDNFLFNDDIAFNVSLDAPLTTSEHIYQALHRVQADHFSESRGGLHMEVGERGRNLSAGEAQLIALARVAARTPSLLILDEATANIDSGTERKVQAAIDELFYGCSVLVIAHRLSTIKRAHKILVLDDGKIVEQGTHSQLMAMGGIYATLYQHGFDAEDHADKN